MSLSANIQESESVVKTCLKANVFMHVSNWHTQRRSCNKRARLDELYKYSCTHKNCRVVVEKC